MFPVSETLGERELDLEVAEVLPSRETLGVHFNINVAPDITVAPTIGTSIAIQVLTNNSNNYAIVSQFVHL
jgi:hypothetical protein